MSISHPWPRASGNLLPAGHIMSPSALELRSTGLWRHQGASGDIMFCPWAAYFPVSLCQGCNIVIMFHSRAGH